MTILRESQRVDFGNMTPPPPPSSWDSNFFREIFLLSVQLYRVSYILRNHLLTDRVTVFIKFWKDMHFLSHVEEGEGYKSEKKLQNV